MKKLLKVLLIVVGSIVSLFLVVILFLVVANTFATISLKSYINKFDKVEYDSQLVPVKDENGYYTFTTDGEFRIMQINDIHIGGGHYSLKKDKKTVYEVMTMVQKEKPDLIILNGDNTFAVPGPMFNGGGTFNNRMAAKRVIQMFEKLGVYFTTTFGNHDTEAFDLFNRKQIGKLYSLDKYKYCIFESNYTGYGVSNQCILLKNSGGDIRKAIMLIDSNDYIDDSLASTINWLYDTIHDDQVKWAKDTITALGNNVKSLFFCHIPIGEFETAYRELANNVFNDTTNTKYISGVWDELVNEKMGGRIWYGGCHKKDVAPEDNDTLFEELGPNGINSMEALFCGHDHVNNAVVEYKGVTLAYGMSIDNIAYDDIALSGKQRGAMVITIKTNNSFTIDHNNAYTHYGVETDKFFNVYLDHYLYEDYAPTNR